jgi:hypothetical protein
MSTVKPEGISMKKGINQSNVFLTIVIVCILLAVSILPVTLAADTKHIKSFDKGPSYKSVVSMEKITFVNFDEDSYLDDYAYLAAVPTKGIDYFMEDWMSYCNGQLDQMTLINVPKNNLDNSWKSKEYDIIDADDPYTIASEIALNDWSYSDNAIIAVIDEDFEVPDNIISNELKETLPACKIHKEPTFQVEQTNSLNPVYHEFSVGDKYRYVKAEAWWDGILIGGNIMIPTGDPDLQLYCRQDGEFSRQRAMLQDEVFLEGFLQFKDHCWVC